MGSLVNSVTDAFGLTDSDAAIDATRRGYAQLTESQRKALEYLQGVDEMPRQYRTGAMTRLADIYGFGDPNAQQEFFSGLSGDPFYEAIMSTMGAREDAYLRNQSATGQLRGGGSVLGLRIVTGKP